MREAGAPAVQEIAFTIANGIEYIQTCIDRGLKIDDFAPRLSFFFCCTIEFLKKLQNSELQENIRKILKERFHAKNPNLYSLDFILRQVVNH